MWLFAETYMEQVRNSMGDQYVAGLQKFMPPWMGFAAIGILFVSSLLGALLGRRMLKNTLKEPVLSRYYIMEGYVPYKPVRVDRFHLDPRSKVLFMFFLQR